MLSPQRFQSRLLRWYDRNARELPWRRTKDPYKIWLSEIMLQQTRVAAVLPYYRKFLRKFPSVGRLASATLEEVLAAWSGLGYYSRARNLHRTAQEVVRLGRFPDTYQGLRKLAGVGDYTAAAVASIAFGLPHAVLDGNVKRVLSRLVCRDTGLKELAATLLDHRDPGRFNQALMELGATVCLPGQPDCPKCPVAALCEAKLCGRQTEFPEKRKRVARIRIAATVLVIRRGCKVLFRQHQGFLELPRAEQIPNARTGSVVGRFRHSIVNRDYEFTVLAAEVRSLPPGSRWLSAQELARLPVGTVARKALQRALSYVNHRKAL